MFLFYFVLLRYVYWSDWGNNPRIERGSMDGAASSRQVLVNTNVGWVNGLTIDYTIYRVFWVDAKVKRIESMKLDGSDRRLIASILTQHPFAVTVFGNYLYYTDWKGRVGRGGKLRRINKFSGRDRSVVRTNIWRNAMDVKIVHPSRQQSGKS
jgi:hypothetical protein